jgi:hypothetical protein
VYQLKIVLQGVRPQIWRRVQVPADIPLDELHLVLQAAMGWTNSHLHAFRFGERRYTMPYEKGDLEELQMEDEREVNLSELIEAPKETFVYDYDFGDNWQHLVTLEKRLPADPNGKYPLCLEGKRACPPEDCGGIWGYADLLKVLRNPAHPEYKDMRAWAGRKFDSEVFDVERFSKDLRKLRSYH